MKTNNAWVGKLFLAIISMICASLLGACGGGGGGDSPSSSAAPPPTGTTAPPTVGVAGGTVSDASGASVIVPPGALATATTIRVANDSSGAPALPAELTAAGNMYAITPHGTTFAEPVDVRIPAPGVTLLPNQELKLAKAQPGGEWEVLGESSYSNGVLTARATSFSYFLPVKVTYLLPIAVTPPFAVTIAASCGLQNCNSATSPVNVTVTVTTNGGQLPNNCSASGFPLRIFAGATPNQETARVPVTGAVFDRSITQQNVDNRYFFTARLSCNSSTGNILASTSIRFLPTPFYPKVNVVRVPPQLDVVAGTSATVDAMLDGAASKMVLDQFGRFESFTAPTINNRALVDWQRSDDAGASWRVVARSYQDEANPLPLGVGLPWRFWSVRHGFIAAANDHNALLRVVACYTPPDVAPPPCVTGPATRLNVLQASALPALADSPRPVLVRTGQTASFSATASGAPAPTLQWQTRAANDSGAWIDVASGTGATTNNYTTPVLTLADNGRQYRVVASNAIGSAASVAVTASVSNSDVAPSITTQPASLAVVAGSEALFAVAARGTEALSYQWRKNGVAITGANNPLLKLPAVSATDGASYAVVISNAAGTVTSQAALLTVSAGVAPLLAPTIVTQPSAVLVPSGNTATFAVGVDGSGPFSFQWLKDGVAITGETRAVFTIARVASENAGGYSVRVSNSVGTLTSQAAGLEVTSSIFTPPPVAPSISTQPATAIVTVGGSATLAVAASGSGPLSYQWSLDGAAIAGATGPILTLSNISALNTGSYSVTVSNSVGSVTSSVAQVLLLGAPAIAQPVTAVSTIAGNAATFSVTATGDNLRYLWMRDGLAIAGATSSSYTIANPTIADNGAVFRVIVYNGSGIVLSQNVVLTVAALPSFSAQPAAASTTAGGTATFSVTAQNAASLRWQRNGVDLVDGADTSGTVIGGAGTSTLTLSSIAASWSGSQFRALATSSGGGATVASDAATLTVTAVAALQKVVYRQRVGAFDNIVTVNIDGSGPVTRLLIDNSDVFADTTPDGKIIIQSTVNNQSDLYSVARDGSNSVALANSADNETIVGTTASNRVIYRRVSSDYRLIDLYSVNSDGTGRIGPLSLTATAENVIIHKMLADGRVVFSKYTAGRLNGIYTSSADLTGVTTALAGPRGIYDNMCAVSPSGKILFSTVKDPNAFNLDADLYVTDAGGAAPVAIGQTTAEESCEAFTATGQVIFKRFTPYPKSDLFASNADGSGEVTISATADRSIYAGSTPSGKIVFYRQDAIGNNSLYITNADGTGTQLLAAIGGFVGTASDERVLYAANVNGQETLFSIKPDGTGLISIEAPFASDRPIGVAPAGRIIYQRSVTNSTSIDLYSANADGTGRLRLDTASFFLGFAK